MSTDVENNKQTVRQAIDALNERDLDKFFSFHTPDTVSNEAALDESVRGEEFRSFLEQFLTAYPDANIENERLLGEGEVVVAINTVTGTFLGPLGDVEPTGWSYTAREAVLFELEDGLIRSATIFLNQKSIDAQLGLI